MAAVTHERYDPYDHSVQDDPYPVYRWLRDESPAHWNDARRFWTLSRFDDVWEAVHDPQRFSSADGIVVGQDLISDLSSAQWPTMITLDPPRHDELRRLVSRAFTPRAIAAMEDDVRSIATGLLDEVTGSAFDLVDGFSGPLPVMVIARMLGVPDGDRAEFKRWSDELVQASPDDPTTVERALAAGSQLYRYFREAIAARNDDSGGDDLISSLIAVREGDQRLDEVELLGICFLLLTAGNETTTNLISNAVSVLTDHPEERRRCADDPTRIPAMVEEVLRFESPVQGLARTLTTDVELHGHTLAEGDKVLLLFAAANRDEREFADADRFQVGRPVERMLAFGHGIHYCLGAALARLEARVAFEELLRRLPKVSVAGEGRRIRSGPVRGFSALPVSA